MPRRTGVAGMCSVPDAPVWRTGKWNGESPLMDMPGKTRKTGRGFPARSVPGPGMKGISGGAGPFAALDYAFASHPSLKEDGGMGTRLDLDAAAFHSLRFSLGGRLVTERTGLNEHLAWQGHFSAAWNHELLGRAGTIHASFAEAAGADFPYVVRTPCRDSVSLGAGVSFVTDRDMFFSVTAGSELSGRGGDTLYGHVNLGWTF